MDSWCGGEATSKSRAKQTEESYQLQLALALRLSSRAASADDPYFLDFNPSDNTKRGLPPDSPESLSHRFWVNGSLSYFDRIPDGFYVIHGLDPYTWSISADSRVPSFESLKAVNDLSIGVVLIDRFRDPGLKEVHNRVIGLSSSLSRTEDVAKHLANVVCNLMGGVVHNEDDSAFAECWKECTNVMKRRLGSVVLPIGSLSIGLCVHRALLFKVLADSINLPCRIVKGCKYCRRDVISSCLVQAGNDREYFVDLLGNPGALSQPDSSLNCSSSILVSSLLSHPRFKSNQTTRDFRTLAKLYFLDSQPLHIVFENSSSGDSLSTSYITHDVSDSDCTNIDEDDKFISRLSKDKKNLLPTSSNNRDTSSSSALPVRQKYTDPVISNPKRAATNNLLFMEVNQSILSKSSNQLHLEEEDLIVPWDELLLKNKIGSGSFGTVYHADWRGSDVAVKILEEQEFYAERFEEFLSEVAIMKRLRHPNIVLFMGAVTQPPNLSIVMEYLSRGSLNKLLHMPDAALILDERRRLNMAYDAAKGMNYLHQFRPPIVHRDLKSLNLLVDSTYTVKICDFGLSRSKAKTYISSTNATGTPEWMAPEVLRNERSNEKSDVYSFGVILWELMTLQHPWRNLKQAQIIAAVGFMGQRLEIPSTVNPSVAALINACLDNDPSKRPPFSYIMENLQELIHNSISQPVVARVR
ncbi:hypothetical protein DKX38_012167 [Salix brachista]|uniref:non-specific serine/threonine protein kinase n=1 Tax=Salix brachista TaxID=2182728 RepID=A0A5N5LMM8_9ROSI|nr:hypothetical protein DKX38_012167 [Salix brachista]